MDLEILQAALAGPLVEGDGGGAVALDIRLFDGVVQNGRKGRCGVEILPGEKLLQEAVVAHAAGVRNPGPLQALNGKVPEGHVGKVGGSLGGLLKLNPATEQEALGGVPSKFILPALGDVDAGAEGGLVLAELLKDSGPDLVLAGAVLNVPLEVGVLDAEIPAHGGNVEGAGALRLKLPLPFILSAGGSGRGNGGRGVRRGRSAAAQAPLLLLLGGDLCGELLNFPLEGLHLGFLLGGQLPLAVLCGVHQGLLTLDSRKASFLLLVHGLNLLLNFCLFEVGFPRRSREFSLAAPPHGQRRRWRLPVPKQ